MHDTNSDLRRLLRWNLLERAALRISKGDPTFQGPRDVLFASIAKAAVSMGISADLLSVLGLAFAIFASILIYDPLFAGILLAVSLFLDGLDGVVARLTGTASVRGELLDVFCDTVGTLFMMAGLVYTNYLSPIYFVIFFTVLVVYTAVSAVKSNILFGKYRSIGSRVAATSYIIGCLLMSQFFGDDVLHSALVNYGVLFVALLLLCNLVWDSLGILVRANDATIFSRQ
jgi:phosphatidylglycerophosphate synthase